MFKDSKYTITYFSLIRKYSSVEYDSRVHEKHHIIPKSMGGVDNVTNIANIPSRVHFILHKLLPKMTIGPVHTQKMKYALWRMMNQQTRGHSREYRVTSSDYERGRAEQKHHMKQNNPMKNPEIAALFRRKRPDQSKVATTRNVKYWATRKLPVLRIQCCTCGKWFETNNGKRICCSQSCAATYRNKKRQLG